VPPGQISPHPGRDGLGDDYGFGSWGGKILWIAATNPAVSLPDLERDEAALMRSPFTVYQEAYYPTETAALCSCPAASDAMGRKDGDND
jgi:ferredoxin-nitrate reductase